MDSQNANHLPRGSLISLRYINDAVVFTYFVVHKCLQTANTLMLYSLFYASFTLNGISQMSQQALQTILTKFLNPTINYSIISITSLSHSLLHTALAKSFSEPSGPLETVLIFGFCSVKRMRVIDSRRTGH